jgi:hypothetical protein
MPMYQTRYAASQAKYMPGESGKFWALFSVTLASFLIVRFIGFDVLIELVVA